MALHMTQRKDYFPASRLFPYVWHTHAQLWRLLYNQEKVIFQKFQLDYRGKRRKVIMHVKSYSKACHLIVVNLISCLISSRLSWVYPQCNFYIIWCDFNCTGIIDWRAVFSFQSFHLYGAVEEVKSEILFAVEVQSKWGEWGTFSPLLPLLLLHPPPPIPLSVRLAGPHCQSGCTAHQTSAPTPLSRTEGAEERCHITWQAKWDVFIRSSTPSQTGANVSSGNPSPLHTSATEASVPLLSALPSWYRPLSFFFLPSQKPSD